MPHKAEPVLTLSTMAGYCDGQLVGADVAIRGATQDSRKIKAGQLFVALSGSQADGHDYLPQVAANGAAAALVSRRCDVDIPQLLVADVEKALQQAATAWRGRLATPLIAITGSCGKTTVKQMLASILAHAGQVLATEGNLNNHLGVPLTLLSLTAEHDYAVIEMGASGAGDIALLCDIAKPNVGLITMVAAAHLEGFGSLKGVAEAKGEIYAGLAPEGIAIMNRQEPWLDGWAAQNNAQLRLGFGADALADVSVSQQHCQSWLDGQAAGSRFELNLPSGSLTVNLPLPGWHNVMNAAAAAAAAVAVSVPAAAIKQGLEAAENVAGRLQISQPANGLQLVDDSYNANPASIKAAAQWLLDLPTQYRPLLVLGEMAEMGEQSLALHQQLGEELKSLGLSHLYCLGTAAAEALAAGFGQGAAYFSDKNSLIQTLLATAQANDVLLVKGSRSAAMDQVVAAITTALQASAGSTNSRTTNSVGA